MDKAWHCCIVQCEWKQRGYSATCLQQKPVMRYHAEPERLIVQMHTLSLTHTCMTNGPVPPSHFMLMPVWCVCVWPSASICIRRAASVPAPRCVVLSTLPAMFGVRASGILIRALFYFQGWKWCSGALVKGIRLLVLNICNATLISVSSAAQRPHIHTDMINNANVASHRKCQSEPGSRESMPETESWRNRMIVVLSNWFAW